MDDTAKISPEVKRVVADYHREMQKRAMDALKAGDFRGFPYNQPRGWLLDAFSCISRRLTDAEYWRLLGEIWSGCERPSKDRKIAIELLTSGRSERNGLMTQEE